MQSKAQRLLLIPHSDPLKRNLHLKKHHPPPWSVCLYFVVFYKLDWDGQQEAMHVEGARVSRLNLKVILLASGLCVGWV